jgi:hypothetical protein
MALRPFRFRAAVVLDLRRKQEEAARLHLARAQAARQQAVAREAAADRATHEAVGGLVAAQATGSEAWRLGWHQSWIRRQRLEADGCRRTSAVSAETVRHATASVGAARQQCRSLERAHDRAWRRHQVDVSRHEGREMNLAANLRYLARAADPGGNDGDD